MTRRERLARLMAALEQEIPQRAEDLARAFGVTPRTIYRDMDALRAGGVAIEGTRGQGYRATHPLTLPPVSLSEVELEVLFLGLAAVAQLEDPELTAAARALGDRLDALLPQERARPVDLAAAADLAPRGGAAMLRHLAIFRAALRARQMLDVTHQGEAHILRPLKLEHWGRVWRVIGWSETADSFLAAPLDAVSDVRPRPELFVDESGKRLEDYTSKPPVTGTG